MKVKEYKVEVRQFLTKANPKYPDKQPVPFRTMYGYIIEETTSGVKLSLKAKLFPASVCMRCGRKITNPVSLQFGLGSECIQKVPGATPLVDDVNLEEYLENLSAKMGAVTWTGWLPKGYIELTETGEEVDVEVPEAKEEPKAEVQNRIYPELSYEQEALIERARFNWMGKPTLMKPTEIWIDKKGTVKLVLEGKGKQTTVKIDRLGERASAGTPYAPKYKRVYELSYNELNAEKPPEKVSGLPKKSAKTKKIDEELVNELVKEISCLL